MPYNKDENIPFPGVDPIPEPDHPDQAATDMLDDVVTAILENKSEEEILQEDNNSRSAPSTQNNNKE